MELEVKKKLFNFLYYFMIIVVIAFCFFLFFYLTSQGKQCLTDPIEFYKQGMGNGENIKCYCMESIFPTP